MNNLIFLILCGFSLLVHAEIQVRVNPSSIGVEDQFQLTLEQTGSKAGGKPNLAELQADFTILGTAHQATYSFVNGKSESSEQWVITLKPKKTGVLTIPAIAVGQEITKPSIIEVHAAGVLNVPDTQSGPSQENEVSLETEVSNKNPFVNQQIIYTVKLYHSKGLIDAHYRGPEVTDALLFPLGNGKQYPRFIHNKEYMVEEQQYAVFPQKSGLLMIKSPVFTGLVYDFDPHKISAKDKPILLNVAAIPKNHQEKEWIPAKQIVLSEQYEHAKDALTQGSTLVREVDISGTALPAQLLPSLHFQETDAFNVYTEKGKEHNQIKQGELVGSTSFKVTYLFKKPGKISIPELQLTWFNTETGKEEAAILPPRSFEISPTSTAISKSPAKNEEITKEPVPLPIKERPFDKLWAILAISFAFLWLLTLLLWLKQGKRPLRNGKEAKALQSLEKACVENNPVQARDALLKWASIYWPDALILSLNDLASLTKDASFKKQLHLLSEALYKKDEESVWHGMALYQSLQALKQKPFKKEKKQENLPPINPP